MTASIIFTVILIVAILVVFYFLLIRPQSKKKKETQRMIDELKIGDIVTTIGGLVGTVCVVKENTFVFEIGADRVRVEAYKWALSTIGFEPETKPNKKKNEKKYEVKELEATK